MMDFARNLGRLGRGDNIQADKLRFDTVKLPTIITFSRFYLCDSVRNSSFDCP